MPMQSLTRTLPTLARRGRACLLGRPDPQQDAFVGLEICLRANSPGEGYHADLEVTDWREFPDLPVTLDLVALRALSADVNAYGMALGQALFADQACGAAYKETLAVARAANKGLRVRLVVEPPELQEVHWERIYHPYAGTWQPLGSTAATPFSRYVAVRQWDRPAPIATRPLRLLVVIASPDDLDTWQLDPIEPVEREALHTLFDGFTTGGRHEVEPIYLESGTAQPPTLNEIRRVLSEGCDLVHFLCHGGKVDRGTVLYLEDEAGKVDPVTTGRLVEVVRMAASQPACCFLAACESAARSRLDAFAPLGPALVDAGGVHATVAMTDRVGLYTAQAFAGHFYARLLAHGLVDRAVNEARALVQDQWDWAVPVLFMRVPDGRLLTMRPPVWCRTLRVLLLALLVIGVTTAAAYPLAQPYLNPTQMTGDYRIAVADFGQIDPSGRVRASPLGTALSRLVFDKLNDEYAANYAQVAGRDALDVQIWHDSLGSDVKNVVFGVMRGTTPEARAARARRLAKRINANIVIYGNLAPTGQDAPEEGLQLEFYNNSETWQGEPDAVTGRHLVGEPIALPVAYETEPLATIDLLNPPLSLRTAALFWITVALTYDINGKQDQALAALLQAKEQLAGWRDDEGQALLEYFIGREAYWLRDYDTAIAALNEAMRLKPDYANPHITLGAVYYDQAQLFYTPQPVPEELAACVQTDHLERAARSPEEAMQLTDQAIDLLDQAIAIAPDSPWPPIASVAHLVQGNNYRLKGQIYLLDGNAEAAALWFDRALAALDEAGQVFAESDQDQYLAWTHLSTGATYYLQGFVHVEAARQAGSDAANRAASLRLADERFNQAEAGFQRCIDVAQTVYDRSFRTEVLDCGCRYYLSQVQQTQEQIQQASEN